MDLIIQRTDEDAVPVRAPAHARHGTSDVERPDRMFAALVATLPHLHCAVVARRRHQLDARTARERSVQCVNDAVVRTELAHPLAGRDVSIDECLVRRYGVKYWRVERPLQIKDRGFVQRCEVGIVSRRRIGPP